MCAASQTALSPDWLLWQLADSAFPAGSFAHSGGVEAAYQYGELRERNEFLKFLEVAIAQAGRAALPFVSAGYDRAEPWTALDLLCDAFTSNYVANRASRSQGQSFLSSAERAFSRDELSALRQEIMRRELPGHFAPVFGAVARTLALRREAALRLFLFIQLRGWISSAVRLSIIGPLEAQSIQTGISPLAEATVKKSADYTLNDLAQTAPLLDIFQGGHDRLYSRLFQS